jgi:DNA-binding GntR family transcriptional regulator
MSSLEFDPAVRSQARRAYQTLRDRIIQCRIQPLQRLKIAELAVEFAISPGAVREALSRLTTEQLVEARDQQGFRAAAISLSDLDDLTATRVQIERLALAQSIARGDRAWEEEVRKALAALALHTGGEPGGEALHAGFHDALVAGCGSRSLMRIRRSLYELSERYRSFANLSRPGARNIGDEHAAIASAAIARFTDAACEALTEHIRITASIVREAMAGAENLKTTDANMT